MTTNEYTQEGRRLAVNTPLGEDALLLIAFAGVEEISRPFRFELNFLALEDAHDPRKVVGKPISFHVLDEDNIPRHFSGVVSSFSYHGRNDRLSLYRAEVVPWLWLLSLRHDCRIFQFKTTEDIVTDVFTRAGFHDFKFELQRPLVEREYCVQYRESDLDFVSRLLEEEGIFYFFEHEETKHTLIMADSRESYRELAEHEEREVSMGSTLSGLQRSDQILTWEHRHQVCTGRWTSRDYNFKKPDTDLTASTKTVVDLENADGLEHYDYPGLYRETSEGEGRVRARIEASEALFDVVRASSICRTYGPGKWFTIKDHHNEAEVGKTYVVRMIRHKASLPGSYLSGAATERFDYANEFEAFPNTIDYRPPLTTPRPRVYGAQTAVVVGPSGEEIYADEYGRIKVQFHWDREGKADESSSCWIRVCQSIAGREWGGLFTPRVGHEVMVEFEEGDPDRPYVTGSVYNENNRPPYAPDKMGTISGFKSDSSKGGGGFNEFRIEDKKGEEQIFIHGEKNLDVRIKNDAFELIGNDRHLIVKKDQIEHVENNREELVDNDHKEKIGKDRNLKVVGKEAKEVGKSQSLTVKDDVIEVFKKNQSTQVTKDLYIKAANICIEATTNITIKVGQSHIAIEAGGIKIGTKGEIKIESTGPTEVKSTAPLKLESSAKADLKSPMSTVAGDGMLTLKGGLVKIN